MDKKKTAAYCRVSTLYDSQDGSFEIQCGYYEKLIQSDPTMEFAGVYGDRGKSGRSIQGREELNRLIHDCEAGRVEISLPKWIQSHKSETALKPLEIRHFTAFATSSAALGEGRFSVLCG